MGDTPSPVKTCPMRLRDIVPQDYTRGEGGFETRPYDGGLHHGGLELQGRMMVCSWGVMLMEG